MSGDEEHADSAEGQGTKRKDRDNSTPPEGYVCRLCSVGGHWIQVCPTKKTGEKYKKKRKTDHVPVSGQDPSEEDIEEAKQMQKIPPPKCWCGLPSRLNRVKRSKAGGDASRAIGKYFFFCSKKRDDETQCRYARPVEEEIKNSEKKAKKLKEKSAKKDEPTDAGRDEKGAKKTETKPICKFFAKTGTCKKGKTCQFSHDVDAGKNGSKKVDKKLESKEKKEKKIQIGVTETEESSESDSEDSSESSSDDSGSSSDSSEN